jgi:CubicO group peptidase (beta-lactamase class C family)
VLQLMARSYGAPDSAAVGAAAAPAEATSVGAAGGALLGRWQAWPLLRWSFMHMDQVCETTSVPPAAVPAVLPVPPAAALEQMTAALLATELRSDYGDVGTVGGVLEGCGADALLVLHRGEVVAERYWRGGAATPRLTQSVTKSVVACLASEVLAGRWAAPLAQVVPGLAPGAALGTATVEQLVGMTAATGFVEAYDEFATGVASSTDQLMADSSSASADMMGLNRAGGWHPRPCPGHGGAQQPAEARAGGEVEPGLPPLYAFLAGLPPHAAGVAHGEEWQYASSNTEAVQWALEAASGGRGVAALAMGGKGIKCLSPLNVLKDTYDHSCY